MWLRILLILLLTCGTAIGQGPIITKGTISAIIRSESGNTANVDSDGQLHVILDGKLDTNNQTTTPLEAGGVFTGVGTNVLGYSCIATLVGSDKAGTLEVQYSPDNVNWYAGEVYDILAGAFKFFTPSAQSSYYRVVYTNGGDAQGTFYIHPVIKKNPIKWSSHNIKDPIVGEDDAVLVLAVSTGLAPDGTFKNVLVTNSGNQKISIEEFENEVSVNSNTQLRVTPFDSAGSDVSGKIYDTRTSTYLGLQFNDGSPQVCSQDYLLALAEGDITGHTTFSKFGRVGGVDNTLVDVWQGASVYVFPDVAQQMNVVSTSGSDDEGGTGVEKITLTGLDANYAEISEEVTLNGTGVVTTTASFLRLNFCRVSQAGSTGGAVGTITIKNTSGTPNTITYGAISIGLTVCRDLVYTVPAGKTLYLTSVAVGSGAGGNALKLNAITFTPKYRLFGDTFFLPAGELFSLNSSQVRSLEMPAVFPEKTDIKMSVQGGYSSGGTACVAAVRGWLE